jgi:hypothetical protein
MTQLGMLLSICRRTSSHSASSVKSASDRSTAVHAPEATSSSDGRGGRLPSGSFDDDDDGR